MAVSWHATGLVAAAWRRLGVKDGRDELARRTGIPATNLSSMNTGKRVMTPEAAEKITRETGVSVLDLGAPEAAATDADLPVVDRLRRLEALVLEGFGLLGLHVQLEPNPGSPLVRKVDIP